MKEILFVVSWAIILFIFIAVLRSHDHRIDKLEKQRSSIKDVYENFLEEVKNGK